MTTWGVAFDEDTLGGDSATGDKKVHVYVNGQPARPDAPLEDGDSVVVAYGTEGSFPTLPPDDALDDALPCHPPSRFARAGPDAQGASASALSAR